MIGVCVSMANMFTRRFLSPIRLGKADGHAGEEGHPAAGRGAAWLVEEGKGKWDLRWKTK